MARTALSQYQLEKRTSCLLTNQILKRGQGEFALPLLSMGKKQIQQKHLETGYWALFNAMMLQAWRDYKRGREDAKHFLESCPLGQRLLETEARLNGKEV